MTPLAMVGITLGVIAFVCVTLLLYALCEVAHNCSEEERRWWGDVDQ